jgi:hypothetical protein
MTVTFVLGVGIGGAGGFVLGCLSSYRAAMKAARPLLDEARRSLETSTQALQEARRRDPGLGTIFGAGIGFCLHDKPRAEP